MKLFWILAASIIALVPALAHHSVDAEFDSKKPVTITGTVTKVDWMNPHIWIYLDVKGKDGKVMKWQFEGSAPNALRRRGWTHDSIKEGDTVTIQGLMARVDGGLSATTGHTQEVTLANGKHVFSGQADEK
jgi:DNA/RNA endonuclease YhcR with UshA esterase domain